MAEWKGRPFQNKHYATSMLGKSTCCSSLFELVHRYNWKNGVSGGRTHVNTDNSRVEVAIPNMGVNIVINLLFEFR